MKHWYCEFEGFYIMLKEIWKNIPGFEGMYQASNLGKIKSLDRIIVRKNGSKLPLKSVILIPTKDTNGYYQVKLKSKSKAIHRLMGLVFLNHSYNKTKKIVIDHINNIKTDNRLENLQLITQRLNSTKDKKGFTSKYAGTYYDKRDKVFRSMIFINKKNIALGSYKNETKAYNVYDLALKNIDKYENPKQFKEYIKDLLL